MSAAGINSANKAERMEKGGLALGECIGGINGSIYLYLFILPYKKWKVGA